MTEPDPFAGLDAEAIMFALTGETVGAGDLGEDYDNSGAVVDLEDGTSMSYDDYIAAGRPEHSDGEPAEDPDPAADLTIIDTPDLSGWAEHRRATISVVGMMHMGEE